MILPDCTYCGESVELDIDIDGAVEACTGCGVAQTVHYVISRDQYQDLRAQVRKAARARMRQHRECQANNCDCHCHTAAAA